VTLPKSSDPPLICTCSSKPSEAPPDLVALLRSEGFSNVQICKIYCDALAAASAQKSAAASRR
jgi:hypothetical protein